MTDPFIKRLGLEAELQVSHTKCVCMFVYVWTQLEKERKTDSILMLIISYSDHDEVSLNSKPLIAPYKLVSTLYGSHHWFMNVIVNGSVRGYIVKHLGQNHYIL